MNIHISRANHDACRMLSSRTFYPQYTGSQFFNKDIIIGKSPVFRITFNQPKSRPILNTCDSSCSKYIISSEQFFCIFMGIGLIIA